jgi:hypothetical protein
MIRQNRIMLQVAGSDDLFWHDSALSRNRTKMFRDLGAVAPFEAVRGIEDKTELLRLRRAKKSLSRKVRNSANFRKAKVRLAKLHVGVCQYSL